MKETEGWVHINKYTDDSGEPICGDCFVLTPCEYYDKNWTGVRRHPGPHCPVWHGESKSEYATHHTEPTEPGYYWWLPLSSTGNEDDPAHWNIVSWHHANPQRHKHGTFVGPLIPPIQEK